MLEQAVVTEKPVHVEQIFINATPEQVWDALTDPDYPAQFFFNGRVTSDFTSGASLTYIDQRDDSLQIEGIIVEADRPRRLVIDEKYVWEPGVLEHAEMLHHSETCHVVRERGGELVHRLPLVREEPVEDPPPRRIRERLKYLIQSGADDM